MPTYPYRCLSCHHVVEMTHGMRERPKLACPACGGFTQKGLANVTIQTHHPAEATEPAVEEQHHCGSACVLHQPKPPAQPQE